MPTGSRWYTGAGSPGAPLGSNDDLYLDLDSGRIFRRREDSWALEGRLRGDNSVQGWMSGSGSPSSTLGNEGQMYVDVDSGTLYRREAETWLVTAELRGPPGPQGAVGPPGDSRPPTIYANWLEERRYFVTERDDFENPRTDHSPTKILELKVRKSGAYLIIAVVESGLKDGRPSTTHLFLRSPIGDAPRRQFAIGRQVIMTAIHRLDAGDEVSLMFNVAVGRVSGFYFSTATRIIALRVSAHPDLTLL